MTTNKNKPTKPKKESPLKSAIQLSGIGIQMGVIIYLFVLLGKWLDANYNNGEKLFIIFTTLLGVAVSLYVVVKQLNRIEY
ncbi:MAG: AtpZ/AtpI family protein [Bacteroidia bacterium]|nr:AtpZ/AtpI family protein [Bacteroidia bacterium]